MCFYHWGSSCGEPAGSTETMARFLHLISVFSAGIGRQSSSLAARGLCKRPRLAAVLGTSTFYDTIPRSPSTTSVDKTSMCARRNTNHTLSQPSGTHTPPQERLPPHRTPRHGLPHRQGWGVCRWSRGVLPFRRPAPISLFTGPATPTSVRAGIRLASVASEEHLERRSRCFRAPTSTVCSAAATATAAAAAAAAAA